MTYTSNRRTVEHRFRNAVAAGLFLATEPYAAAVKRRLAQGYTSGDFKRGLASASVTRVRGTAENPTAYVGTSALSLVDYVIYWELGHVNRFIGRYVRVPVWEPLLTATRAEQERKFAIGFRRAWDRGADA